MIDWVLTEKEFGITVGSKLGKRPKIICRCDGCLKTSVITVRVKSRLSNGFPWMCPSCVGKGRSEELSAQLTKQWNEPEYRAFQSQHRDDAYRESQATKAKHRWEDIDYRSKIGTGINAADFVTQSVATHGDIFDYSGTTFGTWKDPIDVVCRACLHVSRKTPQKQLNFGFCQKCNASVGQRQIADFVKTMCQCVINDRTQISPNELDIYITEKRLAIEFNGLYWHSYGRLETKAERVKHQTKSLACANNNIRLLQFFDSEWAEKRELIESMITHTIGRSIPIDARDLSLVPVDNTVAQPFFDQNHLYGHRHAKTILALFDDKGIVGAASFSKHLDGYEIIRLATRRGVTIRGGASRLITNFKRLNCNQLYTYADMRYSVGGVYKQLGFRQLKITSPNYFYHKHGLILSRQRCQKSKLSSLLDVYDANLSEAANMFANGWRRTWDAGHIKLVL